MHLGINKVPEYVGQDLSKLLEALEAQNSLVKLRFGSEVSRSNHPLCCEDWLEDACGDRYGNYIVKSIDFIPSIGQAIEVGNHIEVVPYEVTIERGL